MHTDKSGTFMKVLTSIYLISCVPNKFTILAENGGYGAENDGSDLNIMTPSWTHIDPEKIAMNFDPESNSALC